MRQCLKKTVWLIAVVALVAITLPAAAAPAVTGISPTSGYPGTQVTYTGTGFGATQGTGSVWLGNKLAGNVVSWSDTQIVAVVAATAATGSASVQQGGVWSNSIAFTVIKPNITSVSPTTGYPGTQVTINGTNFGATQGTGSVWLGNKLAGSIVSWSATQIVATVASTALSGSVQVQQMGVWSNSIAFTVVQPALTAISPTSGAAGTQVTLTGTNFGATQGTGSVWLGSKLAGSIVSWSNTQIVATVASGATSGSAIVQQGGVWSNSIAFTVVTPALDELSNDSAWAGDQITLYGTNFGASQGTGSVWLGSKLATVNSWSDTEITATVASGSLTGAAQVQQGGVWTNSIPFEVHTPVLDSITPASGAVGVTQVWLYGENFSAQGTEGKVWLGTKLATVVYWYDSEVVALVAPGSQSGVAQVFQNGVWSNAIPFTVRAFAVASLDVQPTFTGGYEDNFATVTLTDPAPAGGVVVALSSSEPSVTLPATVTIPEGSTQGFFQIASPEVATALDVTITASFNSSTVTADTQVTPPGVLYFYFDPWQLQSGEETTGHIWLHLPAPAGGAVVSVVSHDPELFTVPATVTVPQGETQWTFTATAGGPVPATTHISATATYNGGAVTTNEDLVILPPTVVGVTVTPTTVVGGEEVSVEVTLSEPAALGTVVEFSTTAGDAPEPLTIAEGEMTGETTMQTVYVDETYAAVVSATIEGPGASASLTLEPPAITIDTFSITPSSLVGTNEATLTVTLTEPAEAGGLEVHLGGSESLSYPPFVVVPEGQTSVSATVETPIVTEETNEYIFAAHLARWRDAMVTLEPPSGNFVTDFSLATSQTAGGNLVTATVTLDAAAGSGGAEIVLESSNTAVATVPASITIAQGNTTGTFDIDTDAVVQPFDVTIRTTYNGVIRTQRLTVVPTSGTVTIQSVTVDPQAVLGGGNVTGTVTLSGPAPSGGAVVTLGGSRPGLATVPASVTVPQGATSATFTITTQRSLYHGRNVRVTGTYDGLVRATTLIVAYSFE